MKRTLSTKHVLRRNKEGFYLFVYLNMAHINIRKVTSNRHYRKQDLEENLHTHVHSSAIYNSYEVKTTQMSYQQRSG